MKNTPVIETERTFLVILTPEHAELMKQYYVDNTDFLSKWEPIRDEKFLTKSLWEKQLQENLDLYNDEIGYRFSALNKNRTKVLGVCNFNNIVRGVFQACHLGYSIDSRYQGKGYMFEILNAGIKYMFDEVNLHRIMANYMPCNKRSENILYRLGFEKEGVAKSYLKIAGKWQDHILTSKINSSFK